MRLRVRGHVRVRVCHAGWERGVHITRRPCCISGCSLFSLRLHGDGSSCSILGLGLAVLGGPPACLPARPPAQPWELPALRPPAAHGPCQAGRKKACLLTPSAQLPGYCGSAQETSGPGHREVGLEPGRLQPREHCPWPAAPWPASSQVRGSSLEAQPQAPGAFRGPGEALSEVFHALPRTPSQPSRPRRPLYSVPVRRFP